MPTSWNQKIASRLGFLKKQENTNYYKKAAKAVNKTHRNTSSGLKGLKRFFMGEGQMMKTYKMIRSLYEANDMAGLARLKNTLEVDLPPFHSGQYTKQVELIRYANYLLSASKANNTTRRQMRNTLITSLDTSHEIGRLMKNDLIMENVPLQNTNSVAMNNNRSPDNYVMMPSGAIFTKTGTPIVGGRTRRRRN